MNETLLNEMKIMQKNSFSWKYEHLKKLFELCKNDVSKRLYENYNAFLPLKYIIRNLYEFLQKFETFS